jgi:hypothetical protein
MIYWPEYSFINDIRLPDVLACCSAGACKALLGRVPV